MEIDYIKHIDYSCRFNTSFLDTKVEESPSDTYSATCDVTDCYPTPNQFSEVKLCYEEEKDNFNVHSRENSTLFGSLNLSSVRFPLRKRIKIKKSRSYLISNQKIRPLILFKSINSGAEFEYLKEISTEIESKNHKILSNTKYSETGEMYLRKMRKQSLSFLSKQRKQLGLRFCTFELSIQYMDILYLSNKRDIKDKNLDSLLLDWKLIAVACLSLAMKCNEIKLFSLSELNYLSGFSIVDSKFILRAETLISNFLDYNFNLSTISLNLDLQLSLILNKSTDNQTKIDTSRLLHCEDVRQELYDQITKLYSATSLLNIYSYKIIASSLIAVQLMRFGWSNFEKLNKLIDMDEQHWKCASQVLDHFV